MVWNFFAASHGKGGVDGVGALLTREVQNEQIKPHGQNLQNVEEIVSFLKSKTNKHHVAHANAWR
jgi:hypothetical protein